MENYKIKVNNEAESKEAQELFFELGYKWCDGKRVQFCWMTYLFVDEKGYITINGNDDDHFLSSKDKELTIHQLRDLVAKSKPTEQGLISCADALRALADGKEVQFLHDSHGWVSALGLNIEQVIGGLFKLRLKPRNITLNVEIPAFGTNYKHGQLIWILNSLEPKEYCSVILDESDELPAYWWQSEEEIKQVVAALRGALK